MPLLSPPIPDTHLTLLLDLSSPFNFSLPPTTPASTLANRTSAILKGLGLSKVASNKIGTPIQRGISGGQKRRVTIGNSLITLPKVLFLDEPTSGLDSQTSYEVMNSISGLAKEFQIIVVATIHSPNWETFSLFDQTLLLAQGSTIYRGPTLEIAPYFSKIGYNCPQHTNPADFVMSLVSSDFNTEEPSASDPFINNKGNAQEMSTFTSPANAKKIDVQEFTTIFKASEKEQRQSDDSLDSGSHGNPPGSGKSLNGVQVFRTFWFKTGILTYRNW